MNIPHVPSYLSLKAIHIIFMVSYFAGLFYLIRLFVYHIDAKKQKEIVKEILQQQYTHMISRLWDIIIIPAGTIMLITGLFMMANNDFYIFHQPWFHVKMTFLLVLAYYHFWSWRCIKVIKIKRFGASSTKLRMMNEVATVILFGVVFIVIFKANFMRMWPSLLMSFIVLVASIMAIVKFVNRKKDK